MKNYVDTSSWTGKRILDLIFKEKASTRLISNNPHADKEVVSGYRSAGMDEALMFLLQCQVLFASSPCIF